MKNYTIEQVEKAIARGTKDPLIQQHIDSYLEAKNRGEDMRFDFRGEVICDNS